MNPYILPPYLKVWLLLTTTLTISLGFANVITWNTNQELRLKCDSIESKEVYWENLKAPTTITIDTCYHKIPNPLTLYRNHHRWFTIQDDSIIWVYLKF